MELEETEREAVLMVNRAKGKNTGNGTAIGMTTNKVDRIGGE